MIKKLLYILLVFILISCGSSKKVTQQKTVKEQPVAVIKPQEKTVEEDIPYKYEEPVETTKTSKTSTNSEKVYSTSVPALADKVIWTAVTYKGTPYKYGGSSKSGMDCSGLIYTSFKARSISLPRNSSQMNEKGYTIPVKYARRGDLLFFKTSGKRGTGKVNHVGVVTSAENGVVNFIHSTASKGVVVSKLSEPYWNKAFVEAKRVID